MTTDHGASGQAHALTLMIPIVRERDAALAGVLNGLPGAQDSPLARIPGTHFARFVILDRLIYEGPPQRRDRWSGSRLLFTSNFDGDPSTYLEAVRVGLGADGERIFGHCVDYPGSSSAQSWTAWINSHAVPTTLFFAAYGERTVEQVRSDLDVRRRLVSLAVESSTLADTDLHSRFREVFG